jgi:hypothetical protein
MVALVESGTPIIELGDPTALEVITQVLSTDAVSVHPGARVTIEGWGGTLPLAAGVRRVEASAFTKVSALGIEEQRVEVIAWIERPPPTLGDRSRVRVRIVTWEAADVLQVPVSALSATAGDDTCTSCSTDGRGAAMSNWATAAIARRKSCRASPMGTSSSRIRATRSPTGRVSAPPEADALPRQPPCPLEPCRDAGVAASGIA